MDKENFFIICLIIGLIFVSVFLGILLTKASEEIRPLLPSKVNNLTKCDNLSLEKTAKCLNEYVKGFYEYNISNVGKELSLEELKKSGGVCSHYSELYKKHSEGLGFYGYVIDIDVNERMGHEFFAIADDTGYCVIDQSKLLGCFFYDTKVLEGDKKWN